GSRQKNDKFAGFFLIHQRAEPPSLAGQPRRGGASKAPSIHDTQAEAIAAARGYLEHQGGGELNIHNKQGAIRGKDTIPPGNDPHVPG
ncbi:DUF2188 domain-containing protein, partial [Propioniciclava flava]